MLPKVPIVMPIHIFWQHFLFFKVYILVVCDTALYWASIADTNTDPILFNK